MDKIDKEKIDNYCKLHSNAESDLLKKIRQYTIQTEPGHAMLSGILVANFLQNLIRISKSKMILEIGMFTGYSAMAMAEVLPNDGVVHTCELMDKHVNTASKFFNQYKYPEKLIIHHGSALSTLNQFAIDAFDFIFIDADKLNYIEYYKKAMDLVKNNGIIVLDNMLWGGDVLSPSSEESEVLNTLNDIITKDSRNTNTLIPIRDGLMLCFKNE